MKDLRNISTPTAATASLYRNGNSVQSAITSDVWHVYYSRGLWNGEYNWERGDNFQSLLAQFNEADNTYIIPLYEKRGNYTGNGSEWLNLHEDVWRFSGTGDFEVGGYIQLDRYCCRIINKSGQDYTLFPHPPATSFANATNEQFYVHGKRVNLFETSHRLYERERVGAFSFEWQEMP